MKNILKFLFIFVFFLGSSISWAEEIKDEIIPSSTGAVLLATVNIENPKIISQNGNTFEISFDLTNREIIQTGVKYSIKLLKETDKGQFLADDKVYPEKISLAENSRISKKISYVAPANLEGDFILVIESKNESGFPFGLTSVGKVSLTASQNSFNVLPETCYLGVDTENNSKKYNLKQGIDILPSENILLNCVLENKKKEEISVNPIFETFFRTIYGEKVEHGLIESKQFILKPEEKKNISVILPKALKPQAYDVKVSFESNGVESNGVVAHYVIRGISATIQNVSLDKDYYKKNEIANISLSWTPGADNFPNTRIKENSAVFETKALISIFNKKGAVCVEKEEYNLPQISIEPRVDIPVSVIEKCKNPLVQISLVDSENNTLDEKNFSFETTTRGLNKNIIILVIILVIVLFLFLIRYLKNKRLNKTAMFSLILLGFILPFSFVKADTYTLGDTNGSFWAYVTIGIDKSEYEPNEKMIVSGNVYYSACANEPADVKLTSRTSRREGSTHSYVGSTITHIDKSIQGGDTIYYSKEETAPSLPHNGYSRQFTASITGSQPGEYLSLYEEIPFLVKGESSCLETHYNCSGGVTSISRTETDSYWEWQCPPVTSGFETKMCKEDKPDHGVCDLTMVNKSYYQGTWTYTTNYGCTVGVSGNQSANKTPSETANWTWTCTGEDGVPVQCLLHMPGLCGTSLLECKQGSAKTSAQAGSWTCKTGETGTADSCKVNIEENTKNGECGETRNTCKVGEPYDGKLINSNTEYSWKCSGLDGGTDSSCVVPSDKPYGSLSAEPDTCIVPIGENSCLIDKVTWQVNNYTDLYGARVWDGVKDIRYNKNPTSTWGRTSVPYTITDFATRGLERNIELRAYSTSSKYTVLDKIKVRAILEENLSPATPTINGDRILTISKTGEWVLYSTDPNNEKIRYGVDWNNDNVVDQWIPDNPETPGNDFVLSGQSVKANYSWSSLGKKTFKVLTQDYYGGNNSPWESFEVEVVSEDQVFVSLTASKYQINEGESTDLKWVSNADTCSSEQFETSSLSNGTKSVSPANTTTYFITCRRGEQMATDNKMITVSSNDETLSVSLTASKYQINEGESTDLKWVSNADTCSSEQFETSSLSNGTKSVSPANTTTYFITCRRGEQMATDNKKITVNGDNPLGLSVTLVAKPSENIKKGQEIVLEWTASREGSFCSIPNPEVEGEYLVKDQSYTGDTGLFKPQKTNIYEVYCQNGSLEARNSVKITVDEFNPIFNER